MDKLGKLASVLTSKVLSAAIGWMGVPLKYASEPCGHHDAVSTSRKRVRHAEVRILPRSPLCFSLSRGGRDREVTEDSVLRSALKVLP